MKQIIWKKKKKKTADHQVVILTSPFFSCQGFGLTCSSVSGGTGGHSSSLSHDEEEESNGGMGELAGHSAGRIMLAGISAPTTASLWKITSHQSNQTADTLYKTTVAEAHILNLCNDNFYCNIR